MTHLQIASVSAGSTDHLAFKRQPATPTRSGIAAAYPFLLKMFALSESTDRHLANSLTYAITDVYQIRDRQHFSASAIAANAHILLEGWAFRSHILPDGTRQITDILVPGDYCSSASHTEDSLSNIEARGLARVAVLDTTLLADRARAVFDHSQRKHQIEVVRRLRARLISLGRRDAGARMAYLIAETYTRLASVGLAEDGAFTWPFTQEHLADILGLTPVHTNRMLARLRSEDLVVVTKRNVAILDWVGLCRAGGFKDADSHDEGSDYGLL